MYSDFWFQFAFNWRIVHFREEELYLCRKNNSFDRKKRIIVEMQTVTSRTSSKDTCAKRYVRAPVHSASAAVAFSKELH
jgi:hypothetical protein